jgi:AAHS family benzoate transporter-like MFS transporter
MTFPQPSSSARPRKSPAVVIFLCFLAIVFDGYDLVV